MDNDNGDPTSGYSQHLHSARPSDTSGAIRDVRDDRPNLDQTFDQTFQVAETTARDDAVTLVHADRITYGIRTIEQIIANANVPSTGGYSNGSLALHRHTWLPQEHHALALYDEYVVSWGTIYHILHFPTARQLIKDVYTRLGRGQTADSSHVALIFSICATGAYFWHAAVSNDEVMFSSESEAERASLIWRKWAMDLLENNRRTRYGTIEDLQASILIAHLLSNVEGFSSRVLSVISTSLSLARDLELQVIDSPRSRKRKEESCGQILMQTKRRLWWYVASTDW